MPSVRKQIKYMVGIYITAHGRADSEDMNEIKLSDREIYIGQEVGNCSLQVSEYDEKLLSIISNWNTEARWLEDGGRIDFDANEDYLIGTYKFEDETKVKHRTTIAKVGPAKKIDKVINMEGRSDEISRPGIVIIIQERDNNHPEKVTTTVRNILKAIYSRGHKQQEEIGEDVTGKGHRFSAVYLNNALIEPNDNTPNNKLSNEFNAFVVNDDELKLSEIIDKAKEISAEIIGLRENDKSILYTIADTTCNVYATEDITQSPKPDQSESDNKKSENKAKQISKFLLPRQYTPHSSVTKPLMASVTPSHGSEFLYVGTEPRLRMREGDRPALTRITEESEGDLSESRDETTSSEKSEGKTESYKPMLPSLKYRTEKELNRSKTERSRKPTVKKTAKKKKIKYSKYRLGSRISQKMAARFMSEVKQMGGRHQVKSRRSDKITRKRKMRNSAKKNRCKRR